MPDFCIEINSLHPDYCLPTQRALKWLQTTDVDGFWAGLIFEQLWSYILGAGTEYRHPDECTVFMCTPEGAAIIPRWETVGSRKLNSPRSIH